MRKPFLAICEQPRSLISGGSRGGSGGSNEPPLEPKLFHFHGEFQEKLDKLHKSNPVSANLNPRSKTKNPGSAPADQHLCCSLSRQYNTSSFYIQNFKTLPSFCGCAGRFESYLVESPGFLLRGLLSFPVKHHVQIFETYCKLKSYSISIDD